MNPFATQSYQKREDLYWNVPEEEKKTNKKNLTWNSLYSQNSKTEVFLSASLIAQLLPAVHAPLISQTTIWLN